MHCMLDTQNAILLFQYYFYATAEIFAILENGFTRILFTFFHSCSSTLCLNAHYNVCVILIYKLGAAMCLRIRRSMLYSKLCNISLAESKNDAFCFMGSYSCRLSVCVLWCGMSNAICTAYQRCCYFVCVYAKLQYQM